MDEIAPNTGIPYQELSQFIGDRIRIARKSHDLTQARLAELIGAKSAATVNRFENGERPPSIRQLLQLQAAIDLDLIKMFRELTAPSEDDLYAELHVERELLLHFIRREANKVSDPVLSRLIKCSIHRLDGDTLNGLLSELRQTEKAACETT